MLEFNNFVTAGEFFLEIAGELILIFVAVSFLIGLLTEYLPPSRIRDFLSGRFTWVQYLLGAGLGAITPFCSCSTVPITAGLLRGGVPFGPTMAFLFSSPVLNPVIIALLLSLLGYKVTVVYVAVTFLGSMAAAFLLSKLGMEGQVKPLMNVQAACCAETGKPDLVSLSPRNQSAAAGCCSPGSVQTSPLITLTALQSSAANRGRETETAVQKPAQAMCCTINFEAPVAVSDSVREPFQEKMKRASSFAVDTFKGVFWYLLLGAAIGAFIYGFFPQDLVVTLAGPGNPWSIPDRGGCWRAHVHPGRNGDPHQRRPGRKGDGGRDGSGTHHRRSRSQHPGDDHSRVHVQKETDRRFRTERFSGCHRGGISCGSPGLLTWKP